MTKSKNNNKHKKPKSTSRAKQFAGDPIDLGPPPDAMKPPEASPIVGGAEGVSEHRTQNPARVEDKELATNETSKISKISKISTGRWALPVMRAFNPFAVVVILLAILTTLQPVSTPTYPWPALDPVPTGTSSTSRSILIGSSLPPTDIPSVATSIESEPASVGFTIVSSGPLVYLPEIPPRPRVRSAPATVLAPPVPTTTPVLRFGLDLGAEEGLQTFDDSGSARGSTRVSLDSVPLPSASDIRNRPSVDQPLPAARRAKLTTTFNDIGERLHGTLNSLGRMLLRRGVPNVPHPSEAAELRMANECIKTLEQELEQQRIKAEDQDAMIAAEQLSEQKLQLAIQEEHRRNEYENEVSIRIAVRNERRATQMLYEAGLKIRVAKAWREYRSTPVGKVSFSP
jgi:hypothetical protein